MNNPWGVSICIVGPIKIQLFIDGFCSFHANKFSTLSKGILRNKKGKKSKIIKIEEGKNKNRFVYENFVDQDLRIKNMHEGTNFTNLVSLLIKVLAWISFYFTCKF